MHAFLFADVSPGVLQAKSGFSVCIRNPALIYKRVRIYLAWLQVQKSKINAARCRRGHTGFPRSVPLEEGLKEGLRDDFMLDYRNSAARVKT